MGQLNVGWGHGDLTPDRPVMVAGQFHARVSEKVMDPVTVTALALDTGEDHVVLVSCDLVTVPDPLRDRVRESLAHCTGLDPMKVVFHATHTHTGPETRTHERGAGHVSKGAGVALDAMPVSDYVAIAAEVMATTVSHAWQARAPGTVSWGEGCAVVGHNRRWVSAAGVATMYGQTDTEGFRHVEGYADHRVGVLATRDGQGGLTGLVVNVPCPSQVSEHEFALSADYWCETRQVLRQRYGDGLHILAQCSVAGDQSPHHIFDKGAEARMLRLSGRTQRQEIARRIAAAVAEVLDTVAATDSGEPGLNHRLETLALPCTTLTEEDVATALNEAEALKAAYEREKTRLEADPAARQAPRWYRGVTAAYRRMRWCEGVAERFRLQSDGFTWPAEIHVVRLGDLVMATNPFEYYLDYGIYIRARSRAVQTMLVQLAGGGTYVPSERSVRGGGYGSIPASNPVGPEGGWRLATRTVALIDELFTPARRGDHSPK